MDYYHWGLRAVYCSGAPSLKDSFGLLISETLLYVLLPDLFFLYIFLTILIVLSNTASSSGFRFLCSAKVVDDLIYSMALFFYKIVGMVAGKLALTSFYFRLLCGENGC